MTGESCFIMLSEDIVFAVTEAHPRGFGNKEKAAFDSS